MITVEEALACARAERREPPALKPRALSEREETQLDYLDAMVERGIYTSFSGETFSFQIPAGVAEFHVIEALKKRWSEGGWLVGIFPIGDGERVLQWQVTFAPSGKIGPLPEKEEKVATLPRLSSLHAPGTAAVQGPQFLVRFPTRSRPVQAVSVLQKYREMAGYPIAIEVIIDEDDETMLAPEVLQRLAGLGCVVTVGAHKTKIEACNDGRVADFDVVMLASDDMVPVQEGWALRVVEEMGRHWPHLDGVIFFNDGKQRDRLCTLPIFGRRLYEQFGYVYEPSYQSLFCDAEQTEVLRAMGRLAYINEVIIEHHHHIWGRAEKDALYERNDALEREDRATYERRKATRQGYAEQHFDAPPVWLSILICSVPERKAQLDQLVGELYRQVLSRRGRFESFMDEGRMDLLINHKAAREVEIIVDDRVEPTVGEKRQALLERAHGRFVAFVDDDDGVAHDYIDRVVSALKRDPEATHASLVGAMTTRGGKPERFEHSTKYTKWETVTRDGARVHLRHPNHLNAVRRGLALRVGFLANNHGEDHDFSNGLLPLLEREASTGDRPLYYYWFNPEKSVQTKGEER